MPNLADFLGMDHRQGAAKDGEILAEDVNGLSVDSAVTSDNRVSGEILLQIRNFNLFYWIFINCIKHRFATTTLIIQCVSQV